MLRSITLAFTLIGFAWSPASASEVGDRSLRLADRADALVQKLIAEWNASGAECDSEEATTAMATFRSVETLSSGLFQRAQREEVRYLRQIYMNDYGPVAIRALNLRLTLADANLAHGCTDVADSLYRGAITIYTGDAYGPYRERARIGVDDVRAMKQKVDDMPEN